MRELFKQRCDAGVTPQSAIVDLEIALKKKDPHKVLEMPDLSKVISLWEQLKQMQRSESICSPAGILAACHPIMVKNNEQLESFKDKPFELICLCVSTRKVLVNETEIVDKVEKTTKVEKLAIDAVFSCYALVKFALLLHSLGHAFAMEADGTYRLLNVGWVVVVMLFTYREWDSTKKAVVQHHVPLTLTLTFTECLESYQVGDL